MIAAGVVSGWFTVSAEGSEPTTSLTLSTARLPNIGLSYLRTRGTLPQLRATGASSDIDEINTQLRDLIVKNEERFRAATASNHSLQPRARESDPGLFETYIDPGLVSASSALVSVLIRVREFQPLGTVQEFWLSTTLTIPMGSAISLQDMFRNPTIGLRALAHATELTLQGNRCVRLSWRSGTTRLYQRALRPVVANYETFALTPTGIAIGFAMDSVAGVPCGAVTAVVPYEAVVRDMNNAGRRLVAEVRAPKLA